ncbi:gp45 [Mycobacterium phage Che9c]|uniref:Uncharacterized protein n=1 Tax=Mycobacterium phage Che9c TaxID=2907832 RepID=Q854V3_9CAUD|nr:gp45 [Mycobacterium phage Che9c]AAN12605.1 hypothetical protein PBI_CHE9C_45 [Mycobacterium phage Che9c]
MTTSSIDHCVQQYTHPTRTLTRGKGRGPGFRVKRRISGGIVAALGVILIAAGVFTSQTLVVLSTGAMSESLRCGTAFHRDEEAATAYAIGRAKRSVMEESLRDLVNQMQSDPNQPGHESSKGHVDLNAECARTLSAKRKWSIGFVSVGVLLAAFGFLMFGLSFRNRQGGDESGRLKSRLQNLVEGARFPTWMRACPDWIQACLVSASGLTGGFAGLANGVARWTWVSVTVVIWIFAVLLSVARSVETVRRKNELNRLKADHQSATQDLLGNQLHSLVQLTAEAVATDDPAERRKQARAARQALISAAAHLVGTVGTRANLFRLSPGRDEMRLEPLAFAGRGKRSTRVFRPGDKTFDLAMIEKGRFVRSAKEELVGHERDVPYETFLTYPVSIGQDRVHGVLTVDSLNSGDLDEARDMPIMALLSALIATAYESEKYPKPR